MATTGIEGHIHGLQPAFGIITVAVVGQDIMAFAGHNHVVIAVQANFHAPTCGMGPQGSQTGPLRSLTFLATKTTAHTPTFRDHLRLGHRQHIGYQMLNFRWMLSRGKNMHAAAFNGHGHGDLPFQIKMFLSTNSDATRSLTFRLGDNLMRVAAQKLVIR